MLSRLSTVFNPIRSHPAVRYDLLGSHRVWATDSARVIVLQTAGRMFAATPDEPAVFVRDVRAETGVA